jgi:hypothetical protein
MVPKNRIGLLGVFPHLEGLLEAVEDLKAKGIPVDTVYSPARNEEIAEALKATSSPVPFFTLIGGFLGVLTGFGLSIYTAVQWRFLVSGKPPVPTVPYVIEAFEFCILFGVLLTAVGVFLLTRLPRIRLPVHYDPRFTEDRFGLLVYCAESDRSNVRELLDKTGAEDVREFHD